MNRTTFQHPFCDEVDAALGRLPYLTSLVPCGFRITAILYVHMIGKDALSVLVTIDLEGISGISTAFTKSRESFDATPDAQQRAVSKFVPELVRELIEREVGPTMQQFVPGRAASP